MIRTTQLWTGDGQIRDEIFHEEPYAMLDLHEEGRMVTRVHYVLTKEEYLSENESDIDKRPIP